MPTVLLAISSDPGVLSLEAREVFNGCGEYSATTTTDCLRRVEIFRGCPTPLAIVLSFTIVALVFTGVGVYGLVSFAVSTRRKECGIRIALGATRANVSRVMAMQGLRPVAAGLTVGVFGGFGAETVLDHYGFLYPVAADRTPMVVAAVILVSVITAAACLFPALRASQVQALPLLRQD